MGVWAFAAALHCAAAPAPLPVERLIAGDRWGEVTRAIFLEARAANASALSVPTGQAKAGFLDDVLDTIAGLHPNLQPSVLLHLVAEVPSMPRERSFALVRQALDLAREVSWKSSDYLRSGELVEVALFYARQGAEADARSIFDEALTTAERGTREQNSGGYQRITESMLKDPAGSKAWMVPLVARHLQQQGNAPNVAVAYRDLARVSLRYEQAELASALMQSGLAAATAIETRSIRASVQQSLADVAVEAGFTGRGLPEPSPETRAVQEARAGKLQAAMAIASSLANGLYVDHGQAVLAAVFDDALKREDLKAAIHVAEHPLRPVSSTQARAWQRIAALQVKRGALQDAAVSYRRAVQAFAESSDAFRYFEEVRAMLALAESMRRSGFGAEGRQAALDALAMVDRIAVRDSADRIRASALVAEALWRLGMRPEAKRQALQAYRIAHGYRDTVIWGQADLLALIGDATATFGRQASEPRTKKRSSKDVR